MVMKILECSLMDFNYFSQILLYSLVLFLFYIPALILVFTVMIPFEILPELFAGSVDPEYFAEDFAYMMEGRLGIFFGVGLLVFIMMIYLSVFLYFRPTTHCRRKNEILGCNGNQ